jgi:hypothetical protein
LTDICKCGVTQKFIGLRHNSSQGAIGDAVYVFFMRAALHGAIDSGHQDAACAFTMNSVARETFHIYIQFS